MLRTKFPVSRPVDSHIGFLVELDVRKELGSKGRVVIRRPVKRALLRLDHSDMRLEGVLELTKLVGEHNVRDLAQPLPEFFTTELQHGSGAN